MNCPFLFSPKTGVCSRRAQSDSIWFTGISRPLQPCKVLTSEIKLTSRGRPGWQVEVTFMRQVSRGESRAYCAMKMRKKIPSQFKRWDVFNRNLEFMISNFPDGGNWNPGLQAHPSLSRIHYVLTEPVFVQRGWKLGLNASPWYCHPYPCRCCHWFCCCRVVVVDTLSRPLRTCFHLLTTCQSKSCPGPIHTGRGTRHVCKFKCFSFDVACVQCGHPHSHQQVPFPCIALRIASRILCGLGLKILLRPRYTAASTLTSALVRFQNNQSTEPRVAFLRNWGVDQSDLTFRPTRNIIIIAAYSVYAMRHSTPTAALMSETCFSDITVHTGLKHSKLTTPSLEQLCLSPAVSLLRLSLVWGVLCDIAVCVGFSLDVCGVLVSEGCVKLHSGPVSFQPQENFFWLPHQLWFESRDPSHTDLLMATL